jgi:hypothetical protein
MKKQWLIVGALVGCLSGASVVACSGTSGTGTTGTGNSTGTGTHTTNSSTGTMTSSSTGGAPTTSSSTGGMTTTGTAAGGADAGTCKPPGTLHPPKLDAGANLYCPFSGVDGGKAVYCNAATEHCCETPAMTTPSMCVPIATACMTGTGYTDWQCEDPVADCMSSATPVCCAPGATLVMGGTMNGMVCQNYASHMTHTACVAAGQCSGIIMCTSDGECPNGQHCITFSKAGNQVGGCM